jgi:two-component system chemotaxis response regulator CheY
MKVLLVDDSRTIRIIIRRKLREAGYDDWNVAEASSGEEALTIAKTAPPDLFLCDFNMPGMSGLDLLVSLRASGCNSKFGFLTSENTEEMRARAVEAGALFLIAKPFTTGDFQQAFELAGLPQ